MQAFIAFSLFVALLWAIQPILHKYAFRSGISPPMIMTVGSVFYMTCMLIYIYAHRHTLKKEASMLDWKTVMYIGTASVLTAFLANLIYFYLIKNHPSYIVMTLTFCSPIFTLLIAAFLLNEEVSYMGMVGVVLVVLGLVLIGMQENANNKK